MRTILVIEPNNDLRELIIDSLNAEDFLAIGAESSLTGVQFAHEYSPNLIVCADQIDELSGLDILERLKRNPSTTTIPFIFLINEIPQENTWTNSNLKSNNFLIKPFKPEDLLKEIFAQLN
jgi:DNA-binding response OmpR family regulator